MTTTARVQVIAAALAGVTLALALYSRGGSSTEGLDGPKVDSDSAEVHATEAKSPGRARGAVREGPRTAIRTASGEPTPLPGPPGDDWESGLATVIGRVARVSGEPVASASVQLYRWGESSSPTRPPSGARSAGLIAGSTKTGGDGGFALRHVQPTGMFLVSVSDPTGLSAWTWVRERVSPGGRVDVGEIVLPEPRRISGRVVDHSGRPVRGASVQLLELPDSFLEQYPLLRFDPEGMFMVRDTALQPRLLRYPHWIHLLARSFGAASTTTDPKGRFTIGNASPNSRRLWIKAVGQAPILHTLARSSDAMVPDLGDLTMPRGRSLALSLRDPEGAPVAGASVLVGSWDSGSLWTTVERCGTTGSEGLVNLSGLPSGDLTLCIRESGARTWYLDDVAAGSERAEVVLPHTCTLFLEVTNSGGVAVKVDGLELRSGEPGLGDERILQLGFDSRVPVEDCLSAVGAGSLRVGGLYPGPYTIHVTAKEHGSVWSMLELTQEACHHRVDLPAPSQPDQGFVTILSASGKPVTGAEILAMEDSEYGIPAEARLLGSTDGEGRLPLRIRHGATASIRAIHSLHGSVGGEAARGQDLVLRFRGRGALTGQVLRGGMAVPAGEFAVTLKPILRGSEGSPTNTPHQEVLALAPDGRFVADALPTGEYSVGVIGIHPRATGLEAVVDQFAQLRVPTFSRRVRAHVRESTTTEVTLELEEPMALDAEVGGTVFVNDRPAMGYQVRFAAESWRASAGVDSLGRFSQRVPSGSIQVSVYAQPYPWDSASVPLWSNRLEVSAGESALVPVDIGVGSVRGDVVDEQGRPVAAARLMAITPDSGAAPALGQLTTSDHTGRFLFSSLASGDWVVRVLAEAGGEGSEPMRVTVPHGASQEAFRFIVPTSAVIKGHVSLSDTELPDPAWAYIAVHEQPAGSSDKPFGEQVSVSAVDTATGTFASAPISCGRYLLRLHVGAPDSRRLSYFCGEVVVGGPDDGELSLHPQADLLEK